MSPTVWMTGLCLCEIVWSSWSWPSSTRTVLTTVEVECVSVFIKLMDTLAQMNSAAFSPFCVCVCFFVVFFVCMCGCYRNACFWLLETCLLGFTGFVYLWSESNTSLWNVKHQYMSDLIFLLSTLSSSVPSLFVHWGYFQPLFRLSSIFITGAVLRVLMFCLLHREQIILLWETFQIQIISQELRGDTAFFAFS